MNAAKRLSISLPPELEQTVVNLRRTERFCRCSYADIIRQLIVAGMKTVAASDDNATADPPATNQ